MPQDYRRFNGPENSESYKRYTDDFKKSKDELYKELFNENGLRIDGRELDEARTLFARAEMISQAKGSSYVEMNGTKVTCSVFDPREIPHQNEFSHLGELFIEVKFAPFSCPRKRRPYVPDAEEKALSAALKKALDPAVCRHMFPNYQIDIFVLIIEHDGSCLAAAVNAAGLALADAVVPMYDIITASSVAVINDQIFVDPVEAEEHLALRMPVKEGGNHGVITVSMLHELKQITDVQQSGSMSVECVTNIIDVMEKESAKIVPSFQKILVLNVIRNCEIKKEIEKENKGQEKILNNKLEEWKKLLNS